jgi:hypothetical protein
VVVVGGTSDVVVVVCGAVPVSGSLDDGGLVDGAWVSGAGTVLTLGAGVVGALPEV